MRESFQDVKDFHAAHLLAEFGGVTAAETVLRRRMQLVQTISVSIYRCDV